MPTWNSRGLRGSAFEEMINRTNEKYEENSLALIQKIPTPITPIEIDQANRHITLAYFDKKSTVDYIGAVQGIPVCFDAKESATDTFNLQNVHDHQVDFMLKFKKQKGIAFFLIYYSKRDLIYYMPIEEMHVFVKRAHDGGRKSFTFSELREEHFLNKHSNVLVPYLDMIAKELAEEKS